MTAPDQQHILDAKDATTNVQLLQLNVRPALLGPLK